MAVFRNLDTDRFFFDEITYSEETSFTGLQKVYFNALQTHIFKKDLIRLIFLVKSYPYWEVYLF